MYEPDHTDHDPRLDELRALKAAVAQGRVFQTKLDALKGLVKFFV